jgi:L-alanine-DL-glutamate epimerase-like enolase superfamily enzyme
MKIERAELSVIGPETKRYTWSHDLPEQFQSVTILRLFTDDGVEGIAGVWNAASYDYDRYTAECLRHLMPIVIGRDPREHTELMFDLRPRVWPLPPGAMALLDIALLDIAGKLANQPLYKLLGGTIDRIPSYASTPMYEDVAAYLDKIVEFLEQGFRAVKFHTWCIAEDDLALAHEARKRFPDVTFMLDAENNYRVDDALVVAKELHALGFEWFEAPLHDSDLEGYRKIVAGSDIPIVPSGNWVQDLSLFEECLRTGVWSRSRADICIMGGITPALEAMRASARAGMRCELMSWGYTLAQAANLHVMLAAGNCSYFEQSLPYDLFEYGSRTLIRTEVDGSVTAPSAPGLGVDVDWEAMAAKTVYSLTCDRTGVR